MESERIVSICRDQHLELRKMLSAWDRVETEPDRAVMNLHRFAGILINHLRLEDQLLYPTLLRADNELLRRKAARYRLQVIALTTGFEMFYRRWGQTGAIAEDRAAFRRESERIKTALLQRLESEDADLYVAAVL